MTYQMAAVCSLSLCAQALSNAQQPAPKLKSFIEKRLSDRLDTPPPPYEALLAVIDGIGKSDPSEIQSALPLLSFALRSKTPNLPTEAIFAFFEIARRPDGGAMLRSSASEIAALMANPDERLSGGAVTTLRQLTRTIPETTVPLMVNELQSSRRPSLVKAEIVRAVLESSKRDDEQTLRAIEGYLAVDADPSVKVQNLHAIRASGFKTVQNTYHRRLRNKCPK